MNPLLQQNGINLYQKYLQKQNYQKYLRKITASKHRACGNLINPFLSFPSAPPVADFTDNFEDDKGWLETGVEFGIDVVTNNRINFNYKRDGAAHGLSKDLTDANALNGPTVDDTLWVYQIRAEITAFNDPTAVDSRGLFPCVSTSLHSSAPRAASDTIGIFFSWLSTGSIFRFTDTDGADPYGGTDFAHAVTTQAYNLEIIRTSGIEATAELDRISPIEQEINVVATTTQDLRYLLMDKENQATNSHEAVGHFDDVNFFDGVSSV